MTAQRLPIVGKLRTYPLAMDVPEGQAHDAWERAARLIHERWAANADFSSETTVSWQQLPEFYRGSNRRAVGTALKIVEAHADHTWNTRAGAPAAAEVHDQPGTKSVADTLSSLRELGYRSRQVWERFRRVGTVTAVQRDQPWTWSTRSGDTTQANAGDWAVRDGDGEKWSVTDEIFRATYEHAEGELWRRGGFVVARPARPGETINTLEGPATAAAGDWVVKGDRGEQWPVPADEFSRRYQGPIPASEAVATRPVTEGN